MRSNRALLFTIGLLILIAAAIAIIIALQPQSPVTDSGTSTTTPVIPVSTNGTLVGTTVCLPHKNPGQVQTLECAFGLQTASSTYYALDTQDVHSEDMTLQQTGIQVQVTGTIVPVEALNSDMWQRYNIKGIMRVKNYEQIQKMPPVVNNSQVTLGLNQTATIKNVTIKPWAVTEDSRCPADVYCIQAGRVVVAVNVTGSAGTVSKELTPGTSITYGTLSITLDTVAPLKTATHKITDAEYQFTFTVK